MSTSWITFFVVVAAMLLVLGWEIWLVATGRETISQLVWRMSPRHPALPFVAGFVTGALAAHFWWAP